MSASTTEVTAPAPETPVLPDEVAARVRARLLPPMPADRFHGWLVTLAVTALAGFLRFWHLGKPGGTIFDEVYYSKDAHDLLRYGVEQNAEGTGPGFVVHPPLGKWAIALGEAARRQRRLGWRIRRGGGRHALGAGDGAGGPADDRSTLLGAVAGLLLTFDALHFVQSRVAMLDIFLHVLGARRRSPAWSPTATSAGRASPPRWTTGRRWSSLGPRLGVPLVAGRRRGLPRRGDRHQVERAVLRRRLRPARLRLGGGGPP